MKAFPLSSPQRRLWFLHAVDPSGFRHSTRREFVVDGPLDLETLTVALGSLVRRHEPLRTTYHLGSDGPYQCISPHLPVTVRVSEDRPEPEPFVLEVDPPLRVVVQPTGPDSHSITFFIHLLAADGWANRILLTELSEFYSAAVENRSASLRPISAQYIDWAEWVAERLTEARRNELLAWWTAELSDLPLMLPACVRQTGQESGECVRAALPGHLMDSVRAVARNRQRTVFPVLAAAWSVVIHGQYGARRFPIGVAVANRDHADVHQTLGFFVDTIPLRIDLADDPTFGQLVDRIADRTVAAYEHRQLPFEWLVDHLSPPREAARSPIVQVCLAHHPAGSLGSLNLAGCVSSEVELASPAKFELTLRVVDHEDGSSTAWLEFDNSLVDAGQADAMLHGFHDVLRRITELTDTRVTALFEVDSTATVIAAVFSDVLGLPTIGVHDDFFALGGTSMGLVQVVARVRHVLGTKLDLGILLARPTPSGAAALATSSPQPGARPTGRTP